MTSKVKGLDRLLRQLAAMPPTVQAAMNAEIEAGAEELAGKIKAAAPRSSKDHEHMAEGIKAEPATGDTTTIAGAKAVAGLAFKVVAPFPARFVEFGTKARVGDYHDEAGHFRHAGTRGHHATAPHPFFWPTVRAWRKPMRSRIGRAANKAAKAVAASF